MQESRKLGFSQRHPLLFGLILVAAAMALLIGAMAAVRHLWADSSGSGRRFGQVNVFGMISDPKPVNEFIAALRDDEDVLGVVIRVDSPGGVVGPSQEIYGAVKRLAAVKPVVVSMGAVAASGGYYLACPARKIIANPGTLTGSIGVKMQLTTLMGLMDKLGVGQETLASGKFKDTPSAFKELTPEERAYLEALVADLYDQFVNDVAEGRRMDPEAVRRIADGRVLSGRQAMAEGLVDGLGGLEEAFDEMKALCQVTEDLPVEEGPKEEESVLRDLILGLLPVNPAQQAYGPRWQALY